MFQQLCLMYSWSSTRNLQCEACWESQWQTDTTWHMQQENGSFQAMPTPAVPSRALQT